MKEVVIIDSGGANLASLQFALERLDARAHVSSSAAEITAYTATAIRTTTIATIDSKVKR